MKEVRLTDNHVLTYDKYQFILKTRVAKKGDLVSVGKFKGSVVKEDRYSDTYYPTIKLVCDHVCEEEFKQVFELYGIKEIANRFDELIKNPHIERLNLATTWFDNLDK